MMGLSIDRVTQIQNSLGEGPVWDVEDAQLWWVDITEGRIHRLDPSSGDSASFDFGAPVGCVARRARASGLIVAAKDGLWTFEPETGTRAFLSDPEAHLPLNRFNDGTTDRQGRFWAGSMRDSGAPTPHGALYRIDGTAGGPPRVMRWRGGITTPNGLAFSPDGTRMYFSDSAPDIRTIWSAPYDPSTGTPGTVEVFFDTRQVAGRPDGGTVDADGCYWQAGISGWQIYRITPKGVLDRVIDLPVEKPTKPMFGGRDLDTLFVTSLGEGLDPTRPQPDAGGLFAITGLGVTGLPQARFAG